MPGLRITQGRESCSIRVFGARLGGEASLKIPTAAARVAPERAASARAAAAITLRMPGGRHRVNPISFETMDYTRSARAQLGERTGSGRERRQASRERSLALPC